MQETAGMAAHVGLLVDYEADTLARSARNEVEDGRKRIADDALPEIKTGNNATGTPTEDKSAMMMTTTTTDEGKQQEEVDGDDGKMQLKETGRAMTTDKAPTTIEVPSQVIRTQELNRIRAKLAAIKQKTHRFNSSVTKKGSDSESYKKEKMDTGTVSGPAASTRRVLRFGRQSNQTQEDGESDSPLV